MERAEIQRFLDEVPRESRVCIYGASRLGHELASTILADRPDIEIACYCDTYKTGSLDGLPIVSATELIERAPSFDWILVASNRWDDVADLLRKSGLLNFKVLKRVPFSGWGMVSEHAVPWSHAEASVVFLQAHADCRDHFDFTGHQIPDDFDSMLYRHWYVAAAARYAVASCRVRHAEFVECGVAAGITSFFALRELKHLASRGVIDTFRMHLYDSWMAMRTELLSPSERLLAGEYEGLDINRTANNLKEFSDHVAFHQGFVPATLSSSPVPHHIAFLHLDLNSSVPTRAALEFFYPRLLDRSLIVFDDYGWPGYEDTKETIHEFIAGKPGVLMPLPTSQALYFVQH